MPWRMRADGPLGSKQAKCARAARCGVRLRRREAGAAAADRAESCSRVRRCRGRGDAAGGRTVTDESTRRRNSGWARMLHSGSAFQWRRQRDLYGSRAGAVVYESRVGAAGGTMMRDSASETRGGPASGLPELRQGRPVGVDLRGAAVAAVVERGMSAAAAARHFGLGESSVRLWVRRFRERGHVRPDRQGGSASRIEPERERIFASWRRGRGFPCTGCAMRGRRGPGIRRTTVQRFLKRRTAWSATAASPASAARGEVGGRDGPIRLNLLDNRRPSLHSGQRLPRSSIRGWRRYSE